MRSADVRADTTVECATLDAATLERLQLERPALAIAVLRNLLESATRTAVQLTTEVAALEA
jgi:CRP-like cAMP-binding protein